MGKFADKEKETSASGCKQCDLGTYADVPGASGCKNCEVGMYQTKLTSGLTCLECSSGRYAEMPQSLLCDSCSPGFHQPKKKSAACIPCMPGRHTIEAGESDCILCLPGYFAPQIERNNSCIQCSTGKYSAKSGRALCFDCPTGWFQQSTAGKICVQCGKETHTAVSGQSECAWCPVGWTTEGNIGASTCQTCSAGKYGSIEASTSNEALERCLECRAGTYREAGDEKSVEQCLECGIGKFMTESGSAFCNDCFPGQVQSRPGQVSCMHCEQKLYMSEKGSSSECHKCPIGKTTNNKGSSFCINCPAGFAGNDCKACQAGQYRSNKEMDATQCVNCAAGYYTNEEGKPFCFSCDAGKFAASEEAQNCLVSPRGSSQPEKGQSTAVVCQAGTYADAEGLLFCKDCDAGKFAESEGSVKCERCPNDEYVFEKRAVACQQCEDETFPNNASTACVPPQWKIPMDCKTGSQFLNDSELDKMEWTCDECLHGGDCNPVKMYGQEMDMDMEMDLARHVHSSNTNRRLQASGNGVLAVQYPRLSAGLQYLPGFWNVTWQEKIHPVFAPCPFEKSCLSTGCTNTTSGVLCAVCVPSHYREHRGAAGCRPCQPGETGVRTAIFVSIAVALVSVLYCCRKPLLRLRRKYIHTWRNVIRLMAINLSYVQINSALPTVFSIPWPPDYLEFLEQFQWVNVDLVSLLGMRCVGGDFWDYRMRIFVACLIPVVWTGFILLLYWCKVREQRAKLATGSVEVVQAARSKALSFLYDGVDLDQDGSIDDYEFQELLRSINYRKTLTSVQLTQMMQDLGAVQVDENESHGRKIAVWRISKEDFNRAGHAGKFDNTLGKKWLQSTERDRIWSEYMVALLVPLFLMHAPVSQRLFYYFACVDVGGRLFLQTDYSLECYQGGHAAFAPFVAVYILLFTVYFPLAILRRMCKHRKHLRAPKTVQQFGFLYANFTIGGEFWELHEIYRKLGELRVILFGF